MMIKTNKVLQLLRNKKRILLTSVLALALLSATSLSAYSLMPEKQAATTNQGSETVEMPEWETVRVASDNPYDFPRQSVMGCVKAETNKKSIYFYHDFAAPIQYFFINNNYYNSVITSPEQYIYSFEVPNRIRNLNWFARTTDYHIQQVANGGVDFTFDCDKVKVMLEDANLE